MQDGIGVGRVLLQQFDGLSRRHDEQFNFDHDVLVVAHPIDPNGAKGEPVELHKSLPPKVSASRYFGVVAPQL